MWKFQLVLILIGLLGISSSLTDIIVTEDSSSLSSSSSSKSNKDDELSSSVISSSVTPSPATIEISSSSLPPSSSPALPSHTEQIVEITSEQPFHQESSTKRRQITYDQRQDGQYNIRADLENFMIVVIPPNPIAGVNLLDLLARSSSKRSNSKKVTKKHQIVPKFNKPSSPVKIDAPINTYGFLSRTHPQSIVPIGGSQKPKFSEFIEGRTPYRVDISSSSSSSSSNPLILSSDRNSDKMQSSESQVDVLPPSFPLHLHLMKPYHLEAEPTIVQSPSPAQSIYRHSSPASIQSKLMEYFNNEYGNIGSRRLAKSQDRPFGIGDLSLNAVVMNAGNGNGKQHNNQKRDIDNALYVTENNNNNGGDGNGEEPFSIYTLFDMLNAEQVDKYRKEIPDFDAIKDRQTEHLISLEPNEECGPDGVRDSYGRCQFFPELFE